MYEMHSLRKFLLEFHKDGVVLSSRFFLLLLS